MRKAEFERAMKAVAAGKTLKEVRVLDVETGEVFEVKGISFDVENDCILIVVE